MRAHRLGKVATIAVLVGGFAAGAALAQDGRVEVQATAQGELGVRKQAVLTPEEQLTQADAIGRRATQLGERLTRMLDEARREKDILRASCVNRKLTEVNANARNVEQRAKALKDAVATGDQSRRDHEYTVLTVLAAKLDSLNQEASQCLGESVYEPGASQVITTVPNNVIVGTDPSTVPVQPPPPPAVNVPPDMSGTI
jgi:hypothetical protein